jgi:DNA-directed RNA polymerase specialized sigma24 family protein
VSYIGDGRRRADRRYARGDADAFASLYRRHLARVVGYLLHTTGDPEVAADLAAEVFAAALASCGRYRSEHGSAALAEVDVMTTMDGLPANERDAVRARVVDEREYREIAGVLECSESVVRQRVSRGLARARARLSVRSETED